MQPNFIRPWWHRLRLPSRRLVPWVVSSNPAGALGGSYYEKKTIFIHDTTKISVVRMKNLYLVFKGTASGASSF
jgi:hypothetical protein